MLNDLIILLVIAGAFILGFFIGASANKNGII